MDDMFARQLLARLDGERNRAALTAELTALFEDGGAPLEQDGELVSDPAEIRRIVAERLDPALARMGRLALLAG
jgi:hypothetical protein